VLGWPSKPSVDDERDSPSYVLMDLLGTVTDVYYHDPYVPVVRLYCVSIPMGRARVRSLGRETLKSFDACAPSRQPSGGQLPGNSRIGPNAIVDTRNAMANVKTKSARCEGVSRGERCRVSGARIHLLDKKKNAEFHWREVGIFRDLNSAELGCWCGVGRRAGAGAAAGVYDHAPAVQEFATTSGTPLTQELATPTRKDC